MKLILYYFILIVNIYISFEQWEKNETNYNDDKSNKSKNLKEFIIQICLIVLSIIMLFIITQLFISICKKRYAYQRLFEGFIGNKLIKEDIINQVKYIYGLKYIFLFLKEKIFLSCKYNQKIDRLKDCGNCSICLNSFNLNDLIFITLCNHVYHNKCMSEYLKLIIKGINPGERDFENFHNYFRCPNCKEYLFINKNFIQQNKNNIRIYNEKINNDLNSNNIENNLVLKNPHNIEGHRKTNNISYESSSTRRLSSMRNESIGKRIKRKKKTIFKKFPNKNNIKIKNIVENNLPGIEGENDSNYQSNMRLKGKIEINNNIYNKNKKSFKVIRNTNSNLKDNLLFNSRKSKMKKEISLDVNNKE